MLWIFLLLQHFGLCWNRPPRPPVPFDRARDLCAVQEAGPGRERDGRVLRLRSRDTQPGDR